MILLPAAAALATALATPAPGPPPDIPRELAISVGVGDLDAARPGDAVTLRRRLHTAAVELCLQATDELTLADAQTAYSQCVATATDHALRDADGVFARRSAVAATTLALR